MIILALDTSGPVAGVALMRDGALVYEANLNHDKTHSQKLMPMVEQALANADLTLAQVDRIAAGMGPGSFTGVRIAVATARALGHARGIPVCGVDTLTLLALNLPETPGLILPLLDARRAQVYAAAFTYEQGRLRALLPPKAQALEAVLEAAEGLDASGPVYLMGDGVAPNRQMLRERLGERARFVPAHLALQRAGSVAYAAAMGYGREGDFTELIPEYLRPSQAERMRQRKLAQPGGEPTQRGAGT